ncbi:MAG TPA: hypothetical protein VMH37_01990 [Candidatus Binataceae bacterium]|nr:hypothetical protein [Candidatus Binataceae bacterium]
MLPARMLIGEIVASLRNVIGPAISEPYPKAQAYMAATILEFVSRQIEEGGASESKKTAIIDALFDDLPKLGLPGRVAPGLSRDEAGVSELIERLFAVRGEIGETAFESAHQRIRKTLRQLLDLQLTITGKSGE